jgi:hypothetical protein
MNAMEGRRRTICEFGYLERCSRSRYLRVVSGVEYERCRDALFPECDSLEKTVLADATAEARRERRRERGIHCL